MGLTIIKTDSFKEVNEKYNTEAGNDLYESVVFELPKQDHHVVVIKKPYWSVIAHEVVHLVNAIFLKCGIELCRINDEPQSYLTGWIINEIGVFLKEIDGVKKEEEDREPKVGDMCFFWNKPSDKTIRVGRLFDILNTECYSYKTETGYTYNNCSLKNPLIK